MRIPPFVIAGVLGLALSASTSVAGKKAGVTMPDTIEVGSQPLVLNGMGLREATWLDIDVYVAGLYVMHPSSNAAQLIAANEPKVLVLRFVRKVSRGDITKAWREGFERNAVVPISQIQQQIAQLEQWTPAFHNHDTLTFTYTPGQGVSVDVNGARKGVLTGEDFAQSLFAIWLGAKPPTTALKRGLLGNHGPTTGAG
jgi:hypothetical protein